MCRCFSFDAVSGSMDELTVDGDRRVQSGPKERTRDNDTGQSSSADRRLVHRVVISAKSSLYSR